MRKVSKATEAKAQRYGVDVELESARRKGATITSWPSVIAVDLITLLGKPPGEATAMDGLTRQEPTEQEGNRRARLLALSDGTQVRFATLGQFTVVQSD